MITNKTCDYNHRFVGLLEVNVQTWEVLGGAVEVTSMVVNSGVSTPHKLAYRAQKPMVLVVYPLLTGTALPSNNQQSWG